MRSVTVNIVLASVMQTSARELVVNHRSDVQNSIDDIANKLANKLVDSMQDSLVDKLVNKLVGNLFDQMFKVSQLHQTYHDDTTLSKPGHLASPFRTSLKPLLPSARGMAVPSLSHPWSLSTQASPPESKSLLALRRSLAHRSRIIGYATSSMDLDEDGPVDPGCFYNGAKFWEEDMTDEDWEDFREEFRKPWLHKIVDYIKPINTGRGDLSDITPETFELLQNAGTDAGRFALKLRGRTDQEIDIIVAGNEFLLECKNALAWRDAEKARREAMSEEERKAEDDELLAQKAARKAKFRQERVAKRKVEEEAWAKRNATQDDYRKTLKEAAMARYGKRWKKS